MGNAMRGRARWNMVLSVLVVVTVIVIIYEALSLQYPSEGSMVTQEDKTVLNNLHKCLDAVDLMEYFRTNGLLGIAEDNALRLFHNIRLFLPKTFDPGPNHCWPMNVTVSLNESSFNGYIGQYHFATELPKVHTDTLTALQQRDVNFSHYSTKVCLPEVFLAGFRKCGSSYLYYVLATHQNISPSVVKEPKWWDEGTLFPNHFSDFVASFAAYLANFILSDENTTIIDGTAGIIAASPGIPRQPKLTGICLLPSVIPEVLPRPKFIVVMRNPVSIVYSTFWFSCTRHGGSVPLKEQSQGPDIFHNRILKMIKAFRSCATKYPLAKCMVDIGVLDWNSLAHGHPEQKSHSVFTHCGHTMINQPMYYIHIQKWLSVVPREQFLFLNLEELSSRNDTDIMRQVCEFLGLPPSKWTHHEKHSTNEQVKVNYHHDHELMMRNDTRSLLQAFYRPFNQKLAELLSSNMTSEENRQESLYGTWID